MKRKHNLLPRLATASTLASIALTASAADKPAESVLGFKKPAWLTDLSIGVKESYDSNVYLSGYGTQKETASAVTTVSPKIGLNFAPLLGDQSVLQTLSLVYAPELVTYHDVMSESYYAQKVGNVIKAKSGPVTLSVDNAFMYVDGHNEGPVYANNGASYSRSSYATTAMRERREQIQDRAKISIQYDLDKVFIRPTASMLYFDFKTAIKDTTLATTPKGYDNYADRYDINGGVDFGYKLNPKFAAVVGYRYGHQYQQQYDFNKNSSGSDYNRVLFGFEGKPLKWLKVEFLAGPDFRNYQEDRADHITPINDKNPVKFYGEGNFTAEISAKDNLALKYKQSQWVASTGALPYMESSYDLTYTHKFSSKLSLNLGGKIANSDYSAGNATTSKRNDWQYIMSTGVRYAFTSYLSADLSYAAELGRNSEDRLTSLVKDQRDYNRHIVSLGVMAKF